MNVLKKTYFIVILLLIGNVCLSQIDTLNSQNLHSPKKAMLYSTIIPGMGQAYNKKYWKIPVIYAGIGGATYFIIDNQKQFNRFKKAYLLRSQNEPDEFQNILSEQALLNEMDRWRGYRDLCIIGATLLYILQIVDANVDAHFYEFDVGDNLSLKIVPKQLDNKFSHTPVLGLGCTIRF